MTRCAFNLAQGVVDMQKYCLAIWIAVIAASGPVRAQYGLGAPVKPTTAEPPLTLPKYAPPMPSEIPVPQQSAPVLQAPVASPYEIPVFPCGCGPLGPCWLHMPPSYPEPVTFGSFGMPNYQPSGFDMSGANYQAPVQPTGGFDGAYYPRPYCPPTYPEPVGYALGVLPARHTSRAHVHTAACAGGKACEPERKSRCWPWCWTGWSKIVPTISFASPAEPEPAAAPKQTPPAEILPTRDDIARMISDGNYSPAEIAAVKIKLDESQAKNRLAAVQYLSTIDCHFYPEAENGLIAALRSDRIESVRFEAAQAMGACRCMTPRMIEAVRIAAMGMDSDGNPGETSDRVRKAASEALKRCPQCQGVPMPMSPNGPVPQWMPPGPMSIVPTAYYYPQYTPTLQQERDVAATVSSDSPATTKTVSPRPIVRWFNDLSITRFLRPTNSSDPTRDPRLQGLHPLGSGAQLAIPTTSYNR